MQSLCSSSWPPALALLIGLGACERSASSTAPALERPAIGVSAATQVREAKVGSTPAEIAARESARERSQVADTFVEAARGPESATPTPGPHLPFRALELTPDAARDALSAMPETRALASGFRLHAAKNLLSALANAGRSAQSLAPWQAATAAFAWSPLPGQNLVILSGDSPAGAALIAYFPAREGPRFAGSFTTRNEHVPILVAYKSDTHDELLYSTCWGCGGEGGALRLDEAQRLHFMPR
jgi:hypothetical protein